MACLGPLCQIEIRSLQVLSGKPCFHSLLESIVMPRGYVKWVTVMYSFCPLWSVNIGR